jgi:exopolysaccharide biosynthesis polyprenyl glycosylphosphotransferase
MNVAREGKNVMDYAKPKETADFNQAANIRRLEEKFHLVTSETTRIANTNFEKPRWSQLARYGLEFLLINAAFTSAFAMRFYLQLGADVPFEYQVPIQNYFGIQIAYSILVMGVLQIKGFYKMPRTAGFLDEFGRIVSGSLISIAILMVVMFITRPLDVSRLMFVYLLPFTIGYLSAERLLVRRIYKILWAKGIGVCNILVVGSTDVAMRLMHSIIQRPTSGYRVIGYVDNEERYSKWTLPAYHGKMGRKRNEVKMLGPISLLPEIIQANEIKQIFIALPGSQYEMIDGVIRQSRRLGVSFTLVPDIYELKLNSLSVQELNGVPLIGYDENKISGWNYVMKRTVDILLSLAAITVSLIPMLLVAIAIKLDSPGPVLFRQPRVGKNGKIFTCFKFRSMYVNADEMLEKIRHMNETGGITFKMSNDPRRTRVGKFIRRTSLDELPQFFNILLGQMSFVGPRPPLPREVERYDDWHYRRLEVTPGLTGLWQVSGRSNLSYEDMVKLDIYYAEHWSIWLDLKIMFKTVPAVMAGDGAC